MDNSIIIVLINILPMAKSAMPGTIVWKPRLGLNLVPPLPIPAAIHPPTKDNVHDGLVVILEGYSIGVTVISVAAGYQGAVKTYKHLNPLYASFYTTAYRWGLRHLNLICEILRTKYVRLGAPQAEGNLRTNRHFSHAHIDMTFTGNLKQFQADFSASVAIGDTCVVKMNSDIITVAVYQIDGSRPSGVLRVKSLVYHNNPRTVEDLKSNRQRASYGNSLPYWLSGKNMRYPDTHKAWRRRYYYMDEFVPKWMRYLTPWIKNKEWEQEEKEYRKYLHFAEPAFGKHYRYPMKQWRSYLSEMTAETVENFYTKETVE